MSKPSSEQPTLAPTVSPVSDSVTLPHIAPMPDSSTLAPSGTGASAAGVAFIPGYELLSELGRGGMGVVYQAQHLKLHRVVALKMILAAGHAGTADRTRFQTEAEAIARLQHPNIVQVYEVGEHEGQPFLSLEFCGGGSLEKKLNGTPLPAREAAALVETLAEAMQAAHEQHVIHRDLKPANVLLTDDETPKITDFGLAKKLDEVGQTQSGAIMGTPSYMAPEQAGGQNEAISPLTDVYALGAILYECLTGRPPFKAATALDTIVQVALEEPVSPSQLQRKTPRDLETICLKCLRKEPVKRYLSAKELADDLRRFLDSEPIQARPVGRVERAAKWMKRNPLVTALVVLVVLSVLAGASGIFVKYLDAKEQEGIARRNAQEAEDKATAARKAEKLADERKTLAEERERETQYQLATSNVLVAQAAWGRNNAAVARERLAAVPPQLRQWEWHYLNRQYQGGLFTLLGHTDIVTSVAFSPDGTRLATASDDQTARLWDARTGGHLLECSGHTGWVMSVTFSPDGTRLATASNDRTARLWDARTGRFLLKCTGHSGAVLSVAFSPDGTRLATASEDQTARLWDARTGHELLKCEGHTRAVLSVSFSLEGRRLATASDDKTARVWDLQTGRELKECTGHTFGVTSVAFSPDGTRLATASYDQTARLWDAQTGQQLQICAGHTDGLLSVAFSPDGRRLATASGDHTARLWDARTGQQLQVCNGHGGDVNCVAFGPEGTQLATASDDKTARLWDTRTGKDLQESTGHTLGVTSVAFNPEGTRLATVSHDGTARLWDARTGQQVLVCKGDFAGDLKCVAFDPSGTRLATASADRTARVWDARTGHLLLECQGHTDQVTSVAFSPDGLRLATASWDRTARLWDARTGKELLKYEGHIDRVLSVAFSPDGLRLATASNDNSARLWDARTGRFLLECTGHTGNVTSVAFSPDGLRLATASNDKTARVWDAQTGRILLQCKGHTSYLTSVSFSPDGTRLATASWDRTECLWDARTGQFLLECKGHTNSVTCVAFSADGAWLATTSEDKTMRLWDARRLPLPQSEELEYRLWATRPEPDWHAEQFKNVQGGDHFAAAFHLDRVLAYAPSQRDVWLRQRTTFLETTLKQDATDAAARLLLARTAWHSPTLGPKDAAALLPLLDDQPPPAGRTRGGLLLRLKKANEAVPVLKAALKDRGDDEPPVEELLLAWAYLDTNQAEKAKALWMKATAWLNRQQEAVRAANVVGTLPGSVLPGVAPLFAPPADPRYNAFDWETWHELDVLRRELTPRFAEQNP